MTYVRISTVLLDGLSYISPEIINPYIYIELPHKNIPSSTGNLLILHLSHAMNTSAGVQYYPVSFMPILHKAHYSTTWRSI